MEVKFEAEQAAAHVMDYLVLLWYRKWLILMSFVVLASAGLFGVFKLITPQYQAFARISVERLRGPVGDAGNLGGNAFFATEYQKIGATEVTAAAAVKLGMSASKEVAAEDGSAAKVAGNITVTPDRDSNVVTVSSKQPDPELAAKIVNSVVEAFVEVTRAEESALAGRFQNDLQAQIVQLDNQIDGKKKALDEFAKDKNLQQQQQEEQIITTRLSALAQAQVSAKVTREQSEKNYDDLRKKADAGENLTATVPSTYADQVKIKIKELQQSKKLMEMGKTEQGLSTDPNYKHTTALIDEYQKDYDESMKTAQADANKATLDRARMAMEQARQVEDTLNGQMAEIKTRLETLATGLTALARFTELKKDLENTQRWHENLQQTLMQARINESFPVLDIRMLDRAMPPKSPAWPNKTQLAAVAVVMSMLVSMGLAFLLDYMDRTVRKPEDVEQELRMPLLGFVPSMGAHHGNGTERAMVVSTDPSSGPSESYRKIRARLFVYKAESHARVYGVTSTTAGEGKSTLASNLAIAFAQAGSRVLLVDGDMRHPMVHKTFNIDREPGLAEHLDGKCSWVSATRESGTAGLSILPCGAAGHRSAELMESPRMKVFLEEAREQYDVVLFDSPPVLGVADSTVLCHAVDATLFVIQASKNPKWLVKRARMELEAGGAHIAGVILNRVRTRRGEYYYYHRYYPTKA